MKSIQERLLANDREAYSARQVLNNTTNFRNAIKRYAEIVDGWATQRTLVVYREAVEKRSIEFSYRLVGWTIVHGMEYPDPDSNEGVAVYYLRLMSDEERAAFRKYVEQLKQGDSDAQ